MLRTIALFALLVPSLTLGAEVPREFLDADWQDDYGRAMSSAREEGQMLVVYFRDTRAGRGRDALDRALLREEAVSSALRHSTNAVIPLDTQAKVKGKTIRLIDHPAFTYMRGQPGVAMIDLANAGESYYGGVVSVLPSGGPYRLDATRLSTLLALPKGTLTQRTLTFAVRCHPERPASTGGVCDAMLAGESESHSRHQARIARQGHHDWNVRFQRITAKLPAGAAKEVCAESWPGQDLLEASRECVQSWRQSPGHWGAVRAAHPRFGYDMKRGRNGVWYATGIFASQGG